LDRDPRRFRLLIDDGVSEEPGVTLHAPFAHELPTIVVAPILLKRRRPKLLFGSPVPRYSDEDVQFMLVVRLKAGEFHICHSNARPPCAVLRGKRWAHRGRHMLHHELGAAETQILI
jgi:hypothetical protein